MAGSIIIQMKPCYHFPTLHSTSSSIPFLHRRLHRRTLPSGPSHCRLRLVCSLPDSSDPLAVALQEETLRILEWPSLCNRLSDFASTSMAVRLTRTAAIPIGTTPEESRKLLDQTAAALHLMEAMEFEQLSLSDVEDISGIVRFAVSGQLLSIRELCTVRRTLFAARSVWEKLVAAAEIAERVPSGRFYPLLDVLQNCNFLTELEQKISFCIDCKLLIVLDRASEDLELIRAERKRNIENLDSLLKEVSLKIYQAGGIDKPLITRRRSRMCVPVRASHKHLLPGCVVLNMSSSGVTYFVEPKEAVDLNNIEVQLSNSERAEEMTILSLLTSEIAQSEVDIKCLLDRVLELDLAFTRAAYARLVNGVCPVLESHEFESSVATGEYSTLSVDIEGMQHPLLLLHHLGKAESLSNDETPSKLDVEGSEIAAKGSLRGPSRIPVPIDIKVGCGKRIVVISGPNTGGKTASMKTLGIASVMSKAGIFLPAKTNPRLPWFDLVLADIGDSQSLEQNLSTFSGHISRICKILEVTSRKSLVLIDEIGSGTDPTEGVALSSSILQYLKQRVNLAVVTTHYADLSLLRDKDHRFENAAMEFSLETLQPTYQILWGSTGVSNALSIAKSIVFDKNIIEGAKKWLETLKPEKQKERKGLLYQSLVEERNKMASQFNKAASLHSDVMELYHEIRLEAEDLDSRVLALKKKTRQKVQEELNTAKYQINTVIQEFENQIRTVSDDEYNSVIKRAESAIALIVKAHHHPDSTFSSSDSDASLYRPQSGEQVRVKGLGNKLATVVEASGDDDAVLVQYGKMRVLVARDRISRATLSSKRNATGSFGQDLRSQFGTGQQNTEIQISSAAETNEDASYGPLLRTSKNSIDLRGMRVEEAAHQLEMAIALRGTKSVLFVVHGMGTGAVKDRALELLKSHPRVTKIEQEKSGKSVVAKEMLAVFEKAIGNPPQELGIPCAGLDGMKTGQEIRENYRSLFPASTVYNLSKGVNFMALSHENESPLHPRSIVVVDNIFCIFIGSLENMCELRRHYGISRATEAMVVVEAYRVLRDRAPYPPDQVVRHLQGKFAFLLYDASFRTLFAARDREASVEFRWGMAGDGSLVWSDDLKIMHEACGKSCAPFPPGCIFRNGSGLMSFDHPLNKMRAVVQEEDGGGISGVIFQVDLYSRLPSIPRTSSGANWADAPVRNAE